MISFLKLWIRLEILNYKFGEGFVKLWKKWWQNKQQGETFKNEELGINFQRITTVFACITSLTFFYSVSEPVLNYPLFVIEGKVFSVVLIHILFVEVALLFSSFKILMLENISKIQSQVQHKLYKLSVSSYVIHLASEK